MKCVSCRKGYNGQNGNGYQPCGCDKKKADPIIPMPGGGPGRKQWPDTWLGRRWIRFRIWRLDRYADGLLKEAEYHKHAAKTHTAASSMFWSKANDIRAAARRLIA